MSRTILKIHNVKNRADTIINQLPFSKIDGDNIVIICPLDNATTLNDHLIWLWGMLQFKRKYLKGLQADGANINIYHKSISSEIEILPNGSALLHLLNIRIVITN